jgi:hypothetical protein
MVEGNGHMNITQLNYLDWGNILVYEIIGNVTLAFLLGMALITYIGITKRLPYQAIFGINIIWAVIILSFSYNLLIWFFIILIIGVLGYGTIAKMIKH